MNDLEIRKNAKEFAEYWADKGYEKGESQKFWLSLLRDILGVQHPEQYINFEDRVVIDNTSFIDGIIPTTHVLIEQKSSGKNLMKPIRQSDGHLLTPFQQAKKYSGELPYSQRPRWIITCNFQEFLIYDMEKPNGEPEKLLLKNLAKEYYRLQFLVDTENENIKKEMEISIKAGEIVGILYDALLGQYNQKDERELKSLNELCVRLVFCLYAEDSGLFGEKLAFHNYLQKNQANVRRALIDLFKTLDTKIEERDEYLDDELAKFPYVNGGLFANENIVIPQFTQEIIDIILHKASEDFDWSEISPTIFGAVFESTLNPETRRSGGMHYTSIENIHKVIDPLFLNDLVLELEGIKSNKVEKTKRQQLETFREKLSKLVFLDPACGSGNFLTETYISLRRLENEALRLEIDSSKNVTSGQIVMGFDDYIKVSIGQFYGIEINDFAVTVAKTALWISESQMMKETEMIVNQQLEFLPLKSYANIVEGNALRIDWNDVVPKDKLSYIMGNPPFVGGMMMSKEQKQDLFDVVGDIRGVGELDFVSGWYFKSAEYIKGTNIEVAFVSTNSICQGQQAVTMWKPLFQKGVKIQFAYRTFVWDNEAQQKARVHCVIVGFSYNNRKSKVIYDNDRPKIVTNINSYLTDADNVFIESVSKPICDVSPIKFGSMPRDGGGFVLSDEEKEILVKKEPLSAQWIHPYIGAYEFINNKSRWCLWLLGANPKEIKMCPTVVKRIEFVKDFRLSSIAEGTRKYAETPTLFCQIAQPNTDYIAVPKTSSEKRKYLPIGFLNKNVIASDLLFLIPNANLYHFGVLTSNVHNAWMRTLCGRLKSDYRYAKDIVYNNFPWPHLNKEMKEKIEKTAKAILDARDKYQDSSLADLYDDVTMPPELRKAHQENDKAVMQAYGFWGKVKTESECVAELMKMYQKLALSKK